LLSDKLLGLTQYFVGPLESSSSSSSSIPVQVRPYTCSEYVESLQGICADD
jgi:hypothetical protein